MGYTEISTKVALQNGNAAYEATEGMEDVEIVSSTSTTVLHELLTPLTDVGMQTGILAVNYHYSHTLNQLLFHQIQELEAAGVTVLVLCRSISSAGSDETTRLPNTFGKLNIVVPGSLREGSYLALTLEKEETGSGSSWRVVKNESLKLTSTK
jgi:hypothetical protein